MDDTAAISRAQLIYGLCLPLAVLLGFLLADPLGQSSVALVGMVLMVLAAPLLIKWHHPLLVLTWNAAVAPAFLPGNPPLWMLVAAASLVFGLLARSTDANRRFLAPAGIIWPLGVLLLVVAITALQTGVGVAAAGSEQYGGRAYFQIGLAAAGFFALVSQRIPRERAGVYIAMFFLPGLTSLVGHLIYLAGPKAYVLFEFFPPTWAVGQAVAAERVDAQAGAGRLGGFSEASVLFLCFLLARHGVRGVMDLGRPWRLCLLIAAFIGIVYAGYRSALILFGLVFVLAFVLEGLHRTRWIFVALLAMLGLGATAVQFLPEMPYVVQRSFAFLPVKLDPAVRADARESTRWRVEMWKEVVTEVPNHLLVGKGYGINPRDLNLALLRDRQGMLGNWGSASVAGNYHNGPLSIILPLGGLGAVAVFWLLAAGGRVLYRNYRYGDPQLRRVNRLLLGYYLARVILFTVVYGSFQMDLAVFLGLIGLGISMNAVPRSAPEVFSLPSEAGRRRLGLEPTPIQRLS